MPIDDLFAEAERQLTICNACRYCAGYCPVWPALELRTELTRGDLTHLANLCHDCRDCFSACMYTAPHEFALNPPKVFTELREDTYRRYVWPRRAPRWLRGWRGLLGWVLLVAALLVALVPLTGGGWPAGSGDPYRVLPHALLVAVAAAPSLWAVGVLAVAVARYWRDVHGDPRDLVRVRFWPRTLVQAAQLRHLRGGGAGCDYPADEPGPARRRYHHALAYGLGLCFLSTVSAAAMQQLLGLLPPYPLWSVPVVTGTVGGLAMTAGCTGLLALKRHSDPRLGTETMRRADYGLLWALLVLAVSGLLTLALRDGAAFGPVLVVHLTAVLVSFALAPYTKFVHGIYRLLAIHKDTCERAVRDC